MNEPFDDILKRKWEEQEFPVDATHREDMVALLDGRKRRRILPFWWIGGLIAVTTLSGLLLYQQLSSPPAATKPALSPMVTPPANNGGTIAQQDEKQSSGQTDPSSDSAPTGSVTTNSNEQPVESKPTLTGADAPAKPVAPKERRTSGISSSTSTATATSVSSKPSIATPSVQQNIPEAKPQYYTVDDSAAKSYQIVSQPVTVIVEPDDVSAAQTAEAIQSRNAKSTDLIDPLDIEGIRYLSIDAPTAIRAASSFHGSFHVFAEAGVGMVLPSEPEYSMGWKLRAGAGVGYKVSPRFALNVSGGYLMQAGGFDFQRSSVVSQPGFGTRSSFNTLTPDKLHYVYARIGAMYHLRRHVLGAHGGIQYLYGTQGNLEVQTMDQLIPGLTPVSSYGWLKKDGLRELIWTADMYYGYQLSPRCMVSIGTDMYFSSFTVENDALAAEGYAWDGTFASFHPFITLNYRLYGRL